MAITDIIPWRRSTPMLSSELSPLSLQREMNRLFEEFWGNGRSRSLTAAEYTYYPEVDIAETDRYVDLAAEVPGMTDKDVRVNLADDGETVIIEGEKRSEHESKSEGLYCAERRYGRFRRAVSLPARVDPNQVDATCKNGVLKVHMKKLSEKEQHIKQIPIKAG